ncbi:MAG: glycyl-radical enzyme activating protein [Bacteroidales bacterium]
MSYIFDIKRYSINDGPGIRLTVFFKGCPLSCIWCHNPEGIDKGQNKLYNKQKCLNCLSCVNICPQTALAMMSDEISTDMSLCTGCGKCAETCPTKALEMSGKEMSTNEIMKIIEKEIIIFDQSRGGVTFCGGEPLYNKEALIELLDRCRKLSIHTTVDTSLHANPEIVKEVAGKCDLLLIDIKHMDSGLHYKYTGVKNEFILSNIKMVAGMGVPYIIRIPLIEGVNADEKNMADTARFISSLPGKMPKVEFLPYHDIAKGKHTKLGSVYNPNNVHMEKPSEEVIDKCVKIFKSTGVEAIVK